MAALGQMSATLAHEVNQPLAAIQTFLASTRLLAERGETPKVLTNLTTIGDLTQRMSEITSHLKTFSRKASNRCERVDIGVAVDRALMLVDPALREARVELAKDATRGCVTLGDPIRLEQVLVNLLRNAIEAMKESEVRLLSVSVAEVGGSCVVRVTDSGPGIPAECLGRLFEPFFTTKAVGLGLGLAVSYGIVRDFGGNIRAEASESGGAAFVIHLPKAPPDA